MHADVFSSNFRAIRNFISIFRIIIRKSLRSLRSMRSLQTSSQYIHLLNHLSHFLVRLESSSHILQQFHRNFHLLQSKHQIIFTLNSTKLRYSSNDVLFTSTIRLFNIFFQINSLVRISSLSKILICLNTFIAMSAISNSMNSEMTKIRIKSIAITHLHVFEYSQNEHRKQQQFHHEMSEH